MDDDKAIRAAKLTLGGMLEKRRAKTAKDRAGGQIAPSKYLPDVPRQVRANGGYVPAATLPIPKLAVARGSGMQAQPSVAETLASLASFGKTATGLYDTFTGKDQGKPQPEQPQQPQDGHAARVEAGGGMSQTAVDAWGRLVDAYGQPLTIVSSYRDPAHNERVGGAKDSQHTHGNAYDIDTSHLSHEERLALADMAWNAGFRGFGFYDNNMHFDVGDPRAWGPSYSRDSIPSWAQDWTSQRYGYADGGPVDGYTPQRTVKAYKLFRRKGDQLFPLFVHANKPVPMGQWLEAEEGPQGKTQGKVKSKLGDLAYRPGWHAGDLPIATHIGGKSSPDLKKPDYRPDDHVWAEIEMAADKDWQSVADSRGKGVKAHITDQVPLGGFYRYKTNPNMTGNWLIGGHMKVNRVLSDDEVKAINDAAGTADLPRRQAFASGGAANAPMFEGIHEDLQDEQGNPLELWHGTPAPQEFEAFDDAKVGSERDHGWYGRGHYLTPDLDQAGEYAGAEDEGTIIGPLHAALKNPYIWDVSNENAAHRTLRDLQSMGIMRGKPKLEPWDIVQRHEMDDFMRTMRERGHDGVIVRTQDHEGDRPHRVSEVVVFKPTAIKHKDAEVFDPTDARIRRADGGRLNLYSKAARVISGMKDQKMDVQDILKYALGKGVKRAELDHVNVPSGKATPKQVADHIEFMQPQIGVRRRGEVMQGNLSDAEMGELRGLLARPTASMSEQEIQRQTELEDSAGGYMSPQYAQYQLPGGKNYREHILTLDDHPDDQTYMAKIHWGRMANPLAHIRMSDRMDGNKKILHIEEMQSDWNNDARRKGFKTGTEQQDYQTYVDKMRDEAVAGIDPTASQQIRNALRAKYNTMDPYMLALKMGRQAEHNEMAQRANPMYGGVPKAPYINPKRDDWAELAMKHILHEAAKGGYDGIAFTPDEAQSERWKGTDFNGIYNKKLPSIAERLVQQHDPDYGSSSAMRIGDYVAPMIELSPEARDSIQKNSFSSFRRGGYVTHVRRAR